MSNLMLLALVSLPTPPLARTVILTMLQFIQFDILTTSDWLVPYLQTFDDDTESEAFPNGLNDFFADNGISSVSYLKNLQSTLVYLCIFLVAHLSYPAIKFIGRYS